MYTKYLTTITFASFFFRWQFIGWELIVQVETHQYTTVIFSIWVTGPRERKEETGIVQVCMWSIDNHSGVFNFSFRRKEIVNDSAFAVWSIFQAVLISQWQTMLSFTFHSRLPVGLVMAAVHSDGISLTYIAHTHKLLCNVHMNRISFKILWIYLITTCHSMGGLMFTSQIYKLWIKDETWLYTLTSSHTLTGNICVLCNRRLYSWLTRLDLTYTLKEKNHKTSNY